MAREFSKKELFAAHELAKADLYFFSRWMFMKRKGYQWLRSGHHKIICDALMRVFTGECKNLIINVPPRYSKTELAVVNFIAWALGRVPDSAFIHVSYSSALAGNNASDCKSLMQHEAYNEIFPATILANDAKAHWVTTAGGVMYATGSEGTLTGFGAGRQRGGFGGAIIIDDPHKADEARSDPVRKGVLDWFMTTLQSRKNDPRNTPIIVIMQRLHENDLAGWLLEGGNGEEWEHVCLPAIQEDGTALWPAKHTVEELRNLETAAPYMFGGQYQQSPSAAEGNVFKPDNIRIIEAIPIGTKFARGWDFAATAGGGDWTVGFKLGLQPNGRWLIADIVRLQGGPEDVEAALVNTAKRDGYSVKIRMPQDPGQAGKSQVAYFGKSLTGFKFTAVPVSGDKIVRAEPFAAQVNVGNVDMLYAPWNDCLISELRMFPNGKNDDQVDAGSDAFTELQGASLSTWANLGRK